MTTPARKHDPEQRATEPNADAVLTRIASAASRSRDDVAGATSIEYALISGLIFLVIATALSTFATSLTGVYGVVQAAIVTK